MSLMGEITFMAGLVTGNGLIPVRLEAAGLYVHLCNNVYVNYMLILYNTRTYTYICITADALTTKLHINPLTRTFFLNNEIYAFLPHTHTYGNHEEGGFLSTLH